MPGALPDTTYDVDLKLVGRRGVPVRATKVFHSGVHPTLRLTTREGFALTGTENHPVLCLVDIAGVPVLQWRTLAEIGPETIVCIDRTHLAMSMAGLSEQDWQLATLAGAFVAEGFVSERRAGFNNTDPDYFDHVVAAYDAVVGGPRYVYQRRIASGSLLHELDVQRLGHLLASPLREMVGFKSAAKRIPSFVWEGSEAFKAAFLQALFEGDGSVRLAMRSSVCIAYTTYSDQLAHEIQALLLEFGVVSRLGFDATRGAWTVRITNRRDARLFEQRVGFFSRKREVLRSALAAVPATSRAMSSDHIPYLGAYLRSEGIRGSRKWLGKHNLDRIERWERDGDDILGRVTPEAARVAEALVAEGFFYARVAAVEPAGDQDVFSVRVESDDHAFIANGFVNHNTECRLAPLAMRLLDGIDEDTVDFSDNYSGEFEEPVVLPARFPNLLVNGSQGIAVGMATNIPPHNLGEVIDATVHLIDNPGATPDDLMQFVKGPDFPTGGPDHGPPGDPRRLPHRQGLDPAAGRRRDRGEASAATGSSSPRCPTRRRSRQRQPASRSWSRAGRSTGIADVNDESAKGKTRLVIKLKKDAPGLVVLNNLYKHTPLQTNFAVNTVALVDGVPRTLNLVQALQAYIDHQVEVIRRRTEYRLGKAHKELHIVEGRLKAVDVIDQVIATIRASDDRAAAKDALMAAPFEFSEVQAEDILAMQLGQLTRLGPRRPRAADRRAADDHRRARGDPRRRGGAARRHQGRAARRSGSEFATERRSQITLDAGDMNIEDLIDDEELIVTLSAKGYTKTVTADTFRSQGRGGKGVAGAKLRDDDYVTHILTTTAHAYLLFFSNLGRVYRLKAHEIPKKERTARGTAIVNLLPAPAGRAHPGDHRHPRLRDATGTCSSPPSRAR